MIIFDSSTLILLAKIDILELFISNFHERVLIPEKVRLEVSAEGREERLLIIKLIEDRKIMTLKVKNSRQIKKLMEDFNIDAGEAAALTLAIQEGANIVATDDRNAIRACKLLNIDFITALAVLIRAVEKALITKDEAIIKLQKLQSVGRYSKEIINDAVKQINGGG
jgi:predicted nucleic acid-binding protein